MKKSKYPKETLSPDKNNLNFKNKNPKNIKTKGKRIAMLPKYCFKSSLMKIKDVLFLVKKDRRRIIPRTMNPNAKRE